MIELLAVISVFAYIYYLKNYADLRTPAEKEEAAVAPGIQLFEEGNIASALAYFEARIRSKPSSAVSYLYRGHCRRVMGKTDQAVADFRTGLGYDDTVYMLHVAIAQTDMEAGAYSEAIEALNKAIYHAGEVDPQVYVLRSQAYRLAGNEAMAQNDNAHAEMLSAGLANVQNGPKKPAEAFFNTRLAANMALVIVTSAITIFIIKKAESIHLPYLIAVISALSIGFIEPRKGWVLAISQCIFLLTGYFLFAKVPESSARQELENFSLYGSMLLTLAASFLGAFLKRALNMQ